MNILITGGTGTFGQAVVKELISSTQRDGNDRIMIYSRDEHKQELMQKRFNHDECLRFFIGDIRDKDRLKLAIRTADVIIHTAALKIVPTAEYNPMECLKTNILGTQNLIEAVQDLYVQGKVGTRVIALSTDKAVYPINLYGSSKLCAEKLIIAANNIHGVDGPKFGVCRYGNVANSNGSVIPVFKAQMEKGIPLTVTSLEMTRFWITIEDAVKFVLECAVDMQGGEIFVPEMPAFSIQTLVKAFSPEHGYKEVGIRPGEKLHESLITKEELLNTEYDINRFIIHPYWKVINSLEEKRSLLDTGLSSNSPFVHKLTEASLIDKLEKIGVLSGSQILKEPGVEGLDICRLEEKESPELHSQQQISGNVS